MNLTTSNLLDTGRPGQGQQQVSYETQDFWEVLYVFLLSLGLVGILFLFQENIGLNWGDEGFLWYGAIQTATGAVPLRDFQAYDPGRYYWVAAWFSVLGQDIIVLRFAVAIFQTFGLTLGLLAARRAVTSWWLLPLVAMVLLAWMYPRHKLFESSLAMMAVYFAVRLIENPTSGQYFKAGIFVGLAAFFGRNHGLYSLLAFFLLILYIWFKLNRYSFFKNLSLWLAGIAVGYAPMVLMLIFIPGLFNHFISLVRLILRHRATNLPLPVPWPWMVDYSQLDLWQSLSAFLGGFFFLLLPLFYLFAGVSIFQTKKEDVLRRSLLIASTFVGVFYMHLAFSRADLPHLAQSIHPFLLGLIALPLAYGVGHRKGVILAGLITLLAVTILAVVLPTSPYIDKQFRAKDQYTLYNLTADRQTWIPKYQAAYIDTVKQLVTRYVGPDEGLLIAPYTPGMYPILQRQSPIRETYLLFPETEERQREIINELVAHQVNWIILADVPLDGRDELRFRHTYPLVWQYIMAKFEPIEVPQLPSDHQFLHRKID